MENVNLLSNNTNISPLVHLACIPISTILELSLAKLMGMETLRHGTTITRAISILSNGTDPQKGGTGASQAAVELGNGKETIKQMRSRCTGQFHVVKDEGFDITRRGQEAPGYHYCSNTPFAKALIAKGFTVYTAYGTAKWHKIASAIINFFFSPILRFHFTKEEREKQFEIDPDFPSVALRTTHVIHNDRLGIASLFKYGSFTGFTKRAQENPLSTIACIAGVALGTLLTCTGLGIII